MPFEEMHAGTLPLIFYERCFIDVILRLYIHNTYIREKLIKKKTSSKHAYRFFRETLRVSRPLARCRPHRLYSIRETIGPVRLIKVSDGPARHRIACAVRHITYARVIDTYGVEKKARVLLLRTYDAVAAAAATRRESPTASRSGNGSFAAAVINRYGHRDWTGVGGLNRVRRAVVITSLQ